jgi:hypothetical protein
LRSDIHENHQSGQAPALEHNRETAAIVSERLLHLEKNGMDAVR